MSRIRPIMIKRIINIKAEFRISAVIAWVSVEIFSEGEKYFREKFEINGTGTNTGAG